MPKYNSNPVSRPDLKERIIRFPEVHAITGYSRTTIRRKEIQGDFPQRVVLGSKSIGWYEDEVYQHLENLPRLDLRSA